MIVRIVLWRLDASDASFEGLRERLDALRALLGRELDLYEEFDAL